MARSTRTTPRRSSRSEAPQSGRLNRNYTEEEYREPSEGYQGPQPNKGLYSVELFDVRDHATQDGNESIRWGWRLVKGSEDSKTGEDVSGFSDYIYTTENTLWREQQMLVAAGVIKPNGKLNLTYEQIIKKAKPCTVRMGQERYIPEDGDPEWRGRMQAFMPLKTDAKATRRKPKDADVEEEVFDDEAFDDEAEETESESSDEEGWPEDSDELAEALEELSLAELKKVAREDFKVKVPRGADAEDLVELILDSLEDSDEEPEEDEEEVEDEPEEEPEPPKRSRRSRVKKADPEPEDDEEDEESAKPARRNRRARGASGARASKSDVDLDPPF